MDNVNDKKYKEYKKKKIAKYLFILLCLVTIFLESLALFGTISFVWGLIPFVLAYTIKYLLSDEFKVKKKEKKKNIKKV